MFFQKKSRKQKNRIGQNVKNWGHQNSRTIDGFFQIVSLVSGRLPIPKKIKDIMDVRVRNP